MPRRVFSHRCEVDGCKNRRGSYSDVKFFNFPRDPDRFKKWLSLINRPDLLQRKTINPLSHLICSVHFELRAFNLELRLAKNALPTKYLSPEEGMNNPKENYLVKFLTEDKSTQTNDKDVDFNGGQYDEKETIDTRTTYKQQNTKTKYKQDKILPLIDPTHTVKNQNRPPKTKKEKRPVKTDQEDITEDFNSAAYDIFIKKYKENSVFSATNIVSGKTGMEIALWEAEIKRSELEKDIALLNVELQKCNASLGNGPYCRF